MFINNNTYNILNYITILVFYFKSITKVLNQNQNVKIQNFVSDFSKSHNVKKNKMRYLYVTIEEKRNTYELVLKVSKMELKK